MTLCKFHHEYIWFCLHFWWLTKRLKTRRVLPSIIIAFKTAKTAPTSMLLWAAARRCLSQDDLIPGKGLPMKTTTDLEWPSINNHLLLTIYSQEGKSFIVSLWTLNWHQLALIDAPENHQETLPVFLLNLFSLIIIQTIFLLLREMEEKISRIPTDASFSIWKWFSTSLH